MATSTAPDLLDLARRHPDEARRILESAGGSDEPRDHAIMASAAEILGLHGLAFQELILAARAEPGNAGFLMRVAEAYRERGDFRRACATLERAVGIPGAPMDAWEALADLYAGERFWEKLRDLARRGRDGGLSEKVTRRWLQRAEPPKPRRQADDLQITTLLDASDADLIRFLALFGGREEVHARQWFDPRTGRGGYSPVEQPLTPRQLRSHLAGDTTLGVYPIRLDGTTGFLAIDLDITRRALEEARSDLDRAHGLRKSAADFAVRIAGDLRRMGFEPLLESSGYKGRHIWVFFHPPQTSARIHRLGELLLRRFAPMTPPGLHLEAFPKQARRKSGKKGLGNLIKLPLGIHRRSGRRSLLLDPAGALIANPFKLLRTMPRTGDEILLQALTALRSLDSEPPAQQQPEPEELLLPPLPPASPAPPPWTDADFETHRKIRHLLSICPVLKQLRRQAEKERRLDYDEQMVLRHTLGHIPEGVLAVNYIFQLVPEIPGDRFLKSRLKGNPISCPKIRQRIPHLTQRLPCNCVFPLAPEHYPTPNLHLLDLPPEPQPDGTEPPSAINGTEPASAINGAEPASAINGAEPASTVQKALSSQLRTAVPHSTADGQGDPASLLQGMARSYQILQRRKAELDAELQQLAAALAAHLKRLPEPHLESGDARIELQTNDGVETVVVTPSNT